LKKTLLLLLSFMLLYTLVLAGCTAADPLPNISAPEPIDERPPEEERREERILRLDEQNLGFPSVYTVSPGVEATC